MNVLALHIDSVPFKTERFVVCMDFCLCLRCQLLYLNEIVF